MLPIVADAECIPCVCLTCAKTAEPMEMPFGAWTRVNQRNCVLAGGPDPPRGRGNFGSHLPAHYESSGISGESQSLFSK